MKRDVREREEFLSFKNLLARKKTSLSKVSKEIGVSREYIYLCFWKNNIKMVEKFFKYVENL